MSDKYVIGNDESRFKELMSRVLNDFKQDIDYTTSCIVHFNRPVHIVSINYTKVRNSNTFKDDDVNVYMVYTYEDLYLLRGIVEEAIAKGVKRKLNDVYNRFNLNTKEYKPFVIWNKSKSQCLTSDDLKKQMFGSISNNLKQWITYVKQQSSNQGIYLNVEEIRGILANIVFKVNKLPSFYVDSDLYNFLCDRLHDMFCYIYNNVEQMIRILTDMNIYIERCYTAHYIMTSNTWQTEINPSYQHMEIEGNATFEELVTNLSNIDATYSNTEKALRMFRL